MQNRTASEILKGDARISGHAAPRMASREGVGDWLEAVRDAGQPPWGSVEDLVTCATAGVGFKLAIEKLLTQACLSMDAVTHQPDSAFRTYARNVREAAVDFLVTHRGRNGWSVQRQVVGESVLQLGCAAAGTIADGATMRSDAVVFVIQSSLDPHRVYLNGDRVAAHGIAVLPPGADFVFTNQVPHRWISISTPLDRLAPRVRDRIDQQVDRREASLLESGPAQFAQLASVAAEAAGLPSRRSPPTAPQRFDSCTEDELINTLTVALTAATPPRPGRNHRVELRRRAIVRQALDRLPEHGLAHVGDLSDAIGVEVRTVRRAFHAVFRTPPLRYLKLRQLNQANAALSDAAARGRLVTDILTRHGVTEFGRFASEYRALFGETPSETIRRHSTQAGRS